ncbi:MAG TPA: NTP transferase domain-containing protein [Candidatus Acidoferrum sp.]|jgi:NDP-sugar pyrophosphorylase family protein|nr:NTP transferase domain-containing protein [Candidatus Acidoferrum sp.]
MPLTLLVLAAGMGSRYGGLKQIDPVGPGGETLMDYSIYDARRAGFDKLVFVIRRDIERPFRETVGRRFENQMEVAYAFQELNQVPARFAVPAGRRKPWGTGHALLAGAEMVREPFAAINADDLYGANSFRGLAEHLHSGGSDYAMVGFVLRNTLSEHGSVARGVCRLNSASFLESVVELTRIERDGEGAKYTDATGKVHPLTGDETVSLNIWGFTPSIFSKVATQFSSFLEQHGQEEKAEFYIPSVVNTLVAGGEARVKVLRTSDSWFGITYREDRERVVAGIRRLIERGDYPEKLWT